MQDVSMSAPVVPADHAIAEAARPRTHSPFSTAMETTLTHHPLPSTNMPSDFLHAFAAPGSSERPALERSGSLDGGGRSYPTMIPPISEDASPAGSTTSLPQGGKKRPKKRGWKGYAMIYYDENGNVIEERPRDETPPKEEKVPAMGFVGRDELSPPGDSIHSRENTAPASMSHSEPPPPALTNTTSGGLDVTLKRPAPLLEVEHPPKSARLPVEKGASMSPLPTSARLPSTEPTSSKRPADRSNPPKKRRKTSPSSATPQPPDLSRSNSAAPSRSKPKAARSIGNTNLSIGTSRTIALAVQKEKDAALSKSRGAGAPPPIEDDSPLPKMPRAGMGETISDPPESDLRNEAIRIISSTDARRAEREKNGIYDPPFDPTANSPPPSPKGAQSTSTNAPYPTPRTAPPPQEEDDFDTQFEKMQRYYEDMNKTQDPRPTGLERPDDPRPPKFIPGQPSTVVLAPPVGHVLPGRRGREKFDKYERAQIDGFDGVADEHVENIKRFVDNVRDNVVTLVDHYFPNIGPKRDAMLEATGRQLADFGWELTDDADAALHPRRESDFSLYYAYARPFGGRH